MKHLPRPRASVVAALAVVAFATALACAGDDSPPPDGDGAAAQPVDGVVLNAEDTAVSESAADVVRVDVQGAPGAHTFAVTVASADTGCDAYADWWEVLTTDGTLLYRRTLAHSHVGEQPFLRSGGPVAVDAEQEVIVRAHMSTTGYGGIVLRGSVAGGFGPDRTAADFAAGVERVEPRPPPCAF